MKRCSNFLFLLSVLVLTGCSNTEKSKLQANKFTATLAIDNTALQNADLDKENWITNGRTYGEDRFSPLNQINKSNLSELSLAWTTVLGTNRGIEATPLVVDGIMYLSGPWSMVYALDARNGSLLWEFDPQVPREFGEKACCDVVNRGVAVYKGLIYVGTIDGRIVAMDAATGTKKWEVVTVDQTKAFTITGAIRVVNGKLIIGNGGAEYGVRGYVSAYDALTGELDWRFYTVPGNPAEGFESEAMEKAAETWTGEWWEFGGGGTAWDAITFDPELNLVYVGTGNGSPWNREVRSPGGGDNLYLSSIVALNADTGEYVWHYQTTPGDSWDYTATQPIILADIEIDGVERKVLMQAPKNGFFYVLDRETGEFISGEPFVYTNWATHIDYETGRPVETSFSRYINANVKIAPSPEGAHSWHPMAFNRKNGLVYIPARESSYKYGPAPGFEFIDNGKDWNLGTNGYDSSFPDLEDNKLRQSIGKLIAYDPVKMEAVWTVEQPSSTNGGVFTTEDLVFQGSQDGIFSAYDADIGEKLWSFDLKTGILAPPMTYMIDGIQYITVAVGWGGVGGLFFPILTEVNNPGTVYTFALNGDAVMPEFPPPPEKELINLPFEATAEELQQGESLYGNYCNRCHGGSIMPTLKYSSPEVYNVFEEIVGEGLFLSKGMPNFGDRLSEQDILNLKHYLLSQGSNNQ